MNPEQDRLEEDARREKNWKRWGPYLTERQWGTVREDYSATGECWTYFPHDHARSRAYRWGEDGLLGICDREGRLCFALALWNGQDPILKERLFGLTGEEVYDFPGLTTLLREGLTGSRTLRVKVALSDGKVKEFNAKIRIDTPQEIEYYKHGGILQYVLRQLAAK